MSEVVYELTELQGSDEKMGHFIRPANYRIPDFCEDCPLVEGGLCEPKVSRVSEALRPTGDVIRIGPLADYIPSVLVLSDKDRPEFNPVYIGELPFVDPFVDFEAPESIALGNAQRRVDACKGPYEKKRLLRAGKIVCGSGLVKVADHRGVGEQLVVAPEAITSGITVVDGTTSAYMNRLIESARAREAAGRSLRDPFGTPESLRRTDAAHQAILKVLGIS